MLLFHKTLINNKSKGGRLSTFSYFIKKKSIDSVGGTSSNAINGISPNNKNRTKYLNAAKVFGL